MEVKDVENVSLTERVQKLEDELKLKTEEMRAQQKQTDMIVNEDRIIRHKLQKCENEMRENEKFKDKWLQYKRMLQELEEKQGNLKLKLTEALKLKDESEKRRREANKMREQAEISKLDSERKRKDCEKLNIELEKKLLIKKMAKDAEEKVYNTVNAVKSNNLRVLGRCIQDSIEGDWWERVDKEVIIGHMMFNPKPTDSSDIEVLENLKIKVAICTERDMLVWRSSYKTESIQFFTLTPFDLPGSLQTIAKFLHYIQKARKSGEGCVYIPLTDDTMVTLVAYYLMITKNCSPEAAVQRLKKIQPRVNFNENQMIGLNHFYLTLNEVWMKDSRIELINKEMEQIQCLLKESDETQERNKQITEKVIEKLKISEQKLRDWENSSKLTKKHFFMGITAVMLVYLSS